VILIAATAMAFNLICSGQTSWSSKIAFAPPDSVGTFEIVYRVDLSSGRYCVNKCTSTRPIHEVTTTRIIFELEERGTLDDTLTFVSRENGRYTDRTRRYISGDTVMINLSQGECRSAPFTGFPALKF